jgi:curli biogenesis system outer membrane secretion channel CsgG
VKKALLISLAFLVFCLTACGTDATTQTQAPLVQTPGQATATPIPASTPIATAKPLTLDQQIQQITLHAVQAVTDGTTATVTVDQGNVTETEKESEQLSNSTTLDHIHLVCYTLM